MPCKLILRFFTFSIACRLDVSPYSHYFEKNRSPNNYGEQRRLIKKLKFARKVHRPIYSARQKTDLSANYKKESLKIINNEKVDVV